MSDTVGNYEIHCELQDNQDHAIDAFVLNRLERDVLSIASRVSEVMGADIQIEAEAIGTGGVKIRWKLSKEAKGTVAIWISIMTLIATIYPQIRDRDLRALQKRDLELSTQERELSIQKLKNELQTCSSGEEKEVTDKAVAILQSDPQVVAKRSALYKELMSVDKVRRISLGGHTHGDYHPEYVSVERTNFDRYVVRNEELPKIRDEDATIEVLSPVLKKEKYKWRGRYADRYIEFAMKDNIFMQMVEQGEIGFRAGCHINCVLNSKQWIDEDGTYRISKHDVSVVFSVDEKGTVKVTDHGRNYRQTITEAKRQMELNGLDLEEPTT